MIYSTNLHGGHLFTLAAQRKGGNKLKFSIVMDGTEEVLAVAYDRFDPGKPMQKIHEKKLASEERVVIDGTTIYVINLGGGPVTIEYWAGDRKRPDG